MTIQRERINHRGGTGNGNVASAPANPLVTYPESERRPMGETEVHLLEMIRLLQILRGRFAERPDVYVGGDLCLYWVPGNNQKMIIPDVFVVFNSHKLPMRRVWLTWEEQAPPTVVFEITSRHTRRRDTGSKKRLYESLGVQEYFLFDPLGEYLHPRLQGFRLERDRFVPIAEAKDGTLFSTALNLQLRGSVPHLRLFDQTTGTELLEDERRAALAQARATVADARADAAEARIRELERQLAERARNPGETA